MRIFPLEKPLISPGLGLVLLLFTTEYTLQKFLPCTEKSRAESPFLLFVCTRELNSPIWLMKYCKIGLNPLEDDISTFFCLSVLKKRDVFSHRECFIINMIKDFFWKALDAASVWLLFLIRLCSLFVLYKSQMGSMTNSEFTWDYELMNMNMTA